MGHNQKDLCHPPSCTMAQGLEHTAVARGCDPTDMSVVSLVEPAAVVRGVLPTPGASNVNVTGLEPQFKTKRRTLTNHVGRVRATI